MMGPMMNPSMGVPPMMGGVPPNMGMNMNKDMMMPMRGPGGPPPPMMGGVPPPVGPNGPVVNRASDVKSRLTNLVRDRERVLSMDLNNGKRLISDILRMVC